MNFTAKDVAALREKTGCGMMDCKKALIASNGDVRRFGVLFLIAFVLDMLSVILQATLKEPAMKMGEKQEKSAARKNNFFKDMAKLFRKDRNIAHYVIAMFLITIGMSFFTFQTAHSKEALGLTGAQLGMVTSIMYIFQTGGSLLWGYVSDRKGYHPASVIDMEQCIGCASCAKICPDSIITVEKF